MAIKNNEARIVSMKIRPRYMVDGGGNNGYETQCDLISGVCLYLESKNCIFRHLGSVDGYDDSKDT